MCIRDRINGLNISEVSNLSIVRTKEFCESIKLEGNAAIIAVSYTHLRAHETVLDLVCRLLLEKKNY